ETAHEAIKEAAVSVALDMRQGQAENDVFARLAADPRLGLTAQQLDSLVAEPITFTGAAVAPTQEVLRRIAEGTARPPHPAAPRPDPVHRRRGRPDPGGRPADRRGHRPAPRRGGVRPRRHSLEALQR